MLLLLHLERETSSIPQLLQPDLKFVLQKCPLLLEEMFKIANLPRPPFGYGWLVSCVFVAAALQN
jgi:translocation protein SEC63